MTELSPRYNPADVEERLYQHWESQGLFHAEPDSTKKPYTIVIPPPNITGILHMGHALNNTIQDILIRWKRMQGFNALWIPGTDHAGIATQNVVEKQLAKDGKRRQDLGREEFLARVWQWKEQYGNTIIRQLKRLGSSCDWSRTRFTMDEGLSQAVAEVFIRLYEKRLIYRGNYIINWCPRCQTALADEEAPHKETRGKLYYVKYPLVTSDECSVTSKTKKQVTRHSLLATRHFIVVATTRPETMLGDTAVAVHPTDKRYAKLIGQKILLPLVNREITIIADEAIDPEFGTGAVKVTPAHDPVDFQLGKKHSLEFINVMTDDGHMTNVPAPYQGLDRFECRKRVLEDLEKLGLLEKVADHQHAVGHCYRCDTVVEPRLSLQWFVKMKPLAKEAVKAVKDKKIVFTPSRWTKVYLNWMENIQDWCISRQIWWGHRLPVYYCQKCVRQEAVHSPQSIVHSRRKASHESGVIVSKTRPAKCPQCGSTELKQDEDVLDTWFSSWLWPFSTLGWPEKTKDLAYFYPTNTLVTAPEIIFFWVARMIMAGFFCMKKMPFEKVYIHGTVRDLTGKKMSKSLGNIIDPLEIIERYGTDALRYTLVTSTAVGTDVFISDDKFVIGRNFANKLWNATRYVLSLGAGGTGQETGEFLNSRPSPLAPRPVTVLDRWLLSRLQRTITDATKSLDRCAFNEAAHAVYDFLWRDYCDWYLECSKTVPAAKRQTTVAILIHALETSFRLLHPIMPFVTEELWQHLNQIRNAEFGMRNEKSNTPNSELRTPNSIMMAAWPVANKKLLDAEAEEQIALFQAVVTAIRNTKAELNVPAETRPPVYVSAGRVEIRRFFEEQRPLIQTLAAVDEVTVGDGTVKPRDAAATVVDGIEVLVPLAGIIDVTRERERLGVRVKELSEQLSRVEARLKDRQFVQRAPEDVVAQAKAQRAQVAETLQKFTSHLRLLESM